MTDKLSIRTMADYAAAGETPEVLFWVGCMGSFDDRAKKVTKAFAKLLNNAGVKFAVLGQEESCTGDPA
ncbi:MAG TPA: (Fe-S)-binding protein, partial [Flavobacteriales bacterium]|nr:(Fe-S)-binding protein [Flavobacteriales bacterium]